MRQAPATKGAARERPPIISRSAAAEDAPALQGVDYQRLTGRAEEQRDRVETLRRDAARRALPEL